MDALRALLHSVYDQPDGPAVHAQFDRIIDALEHKLPAVAEHLATARTNIVAFAAFPKEIWSNNTDERLNREIRRRTDVDGIFPDHNSSIRLADGFEFGFGHLLGLGDGAGGL